MNVDAVHCLNTTFRRTIRRRCTEAIQKYALLIKGDKIAVCISGGKDSMLLAVLLQELQKYGEVPFSLEFLAMDPGYSAQNRQQLQENARELGIPLQVFETNVFQVAKNHGKNPCFLCAKMRRGWLYSQAKALGCNKIALGHHYDDVVETILMAMIYGGQVQTMLPKLKSDHFPGMELIRPLYFVREESIKQWVHENSLLFLDCACEAQKEKQTGKREAIKILLAELCKTNPQVKQNIMNSVKNINLRQVLGYHKGQETHCFLEDYDEGVL